MEKGCSPASNYIEGAKEAQRAQPTATRTTQLKPTQPKPSTSQVRLLNGIRGGAVQGVKGAKRFPERSNLKESMSKLREVVEDCVSSNSQHGFAVVLDDESSTETGVLETFEISSSNSLPNCNTGHATSAAPSSNGVVGVVVPVDDSSSTDTLGNGNEDNVLPCAASEEGHSVFFHNDNIDNDNDEQPVVCLINDEDDFDEEEIVEEEEEEDDEEEDQSRMPQLDCPNTSSQLNVGKGSESIIVTADGSKIFLETPVVDEPQSHTHTLTHTHTHTHSSSNSQGSNQEATEQGKPKRLSDEFESEANRAQDDDEVEEHEEEMVEGGIKSEPDVASTSLHDRQMSVRLKQMSLGAEAAASSSSSASQSLSKADIESMDRIERRDFEREQQLTGGIILGTSSLISKNRLNLSLINGAGAGVVGAGAAAGGAGGGNDDWPSSSSNGRAFNSDSKVSWSGLTASILIHFYID